jgi:hypothetical protein
MDNTTVDFGGSTGEADSDGMSFGARVGYKFTGFWASVDIETGSSKELTPSTGLATDASLSNTGLAVGVSLMPMVNFYAKYLMTAKLEYGTASTVELKGSGTAFGIGWSVIPMVSLNLEYRSINYDEIDGNALATEIGHKGLTVGISVPFSL